MEKDQEISRLTRILRGIARADRFRLRREPSQDAIRFNVDQFNKVLSRLIELEPGTAPLFAPLPEHATLEMARMAAHDLASYFADDTNEEKKRPHIYRFKVCGARVTVGTVPSGGSCG